jgi:hypothetical protein
MVAEQRETVQRIDADTTDIADNISGAQRELLKYYASISSNRWLMIKVFGALIVVVSSVSAILCLSRRRRVLTTNVCSSYCLFSLIDGLGSNCLCILSIIMYFSYLAIPTALRYYKIPVLYSIEEPTDCGYSRWLLGFYFLDIALHLV